MKVQGVQRDWVAGIPENLNCNVHPSRLRIATGIYRLTSLQQGNFMRQSLIPGSHIKLEDHWSGEPNEVEQ
jgi:hypothetical protein